MAKKVFAMLYYSILVPIMAVAKKVSAVLYGVFVPIVVYFVIPLMGIKTPFKEIIALIFIGALPSFIIYKLYKEACECKALSMIDPLSGLYNRRGGANAFRLELGAIFRERKHRSGVDVCVIMIDIDDFKKINDQYGHARGNEVIKDLCDEIKQVFTRSTDTCSRPGGDEFTVVLLRTTIDVTIAKVVTICRTLIEDKKFLLSDKDGREHVTLSIGIATDEVLYEERGEDGWGEKIDRITHRADRALYKSKALGRNRTTAIVKAPTRDRREIVTTTVNGEEEDWSAHDRIHDLFAKLDE